MKTALLFFILGVLTFVAYQYHEEAKRQDRERLERAVSDCWKNVAPLGPSGVTTCERMAKQLEGLK
jgi:hypothetical protein